MGLHNQEDERQQSWKRQSESLSEACYLEIVYEFSRNKVISVKFEPGPVWKNSSILPDSCMAAGRQHLLLPPQRQYWLLLARDTSMFFKTSPFSRDDTLVPYLPFDNFHRSLFQCEKLLLAEAAQHHKGYSYSDLKNISQPCEPQSFPHIICGPFPHSWCLTLFLLTLAQQEAQYNGLVVKQSLVTARYSQFPDKA